MDGAELKAEEKADGGANGDRFRQGRRRIEFGGLAKRQIFPSNYVSTTRYKWWTIIPLNLFEQFHRVANIWFLIVSVLQMLPFKISPTTSWATLVPLCGVLFVTFCKDAYEDLKRWRDDCRVNNQTCKVFTGAEGPNAFRSIKWSEVQVGNFVKLTRDQPVPADLLLVFSTPGGAAFVDTAQLDGESSLKPKQAVDETQHMIRNSSVHSVEGHMEADLPNQVVGKFDGCIYLKGYPRGVTVNLKHFLLRGSTVRNTHHVIGLVVYTGVDTKVVRNSSRSLTSKRSQVEQLSNKLLVIVFVLLFVISIASAVVRAYLITDEEGYRNLSWVWPLTRGDDLQDNPYMAILTFLIGYNNLIPISLYMTTDLVRALQAFIMESDESMYHKATESACKVRSSGLCEDLGQVDFVLSDKTGTLTQNEMCFKACYVDGQTYGYWSETVDDSLEADDDASMSLGSGIMGYPSDRVERLPPRSVCLPLSQQLWTAPVDPEPAEKSLILQNFFLCLATCHTAMPERQGAVTPTNTKRTSRSSEVPVVMQDPEAVRANDPGMQDLHLECDIQQRMALLEEAESTQFRSPSPDEEALLAMARDFGFFFQKRQSGKITINIRGQQVYYQVLICNEFTSDRKRMSVLLRRCSEETAAANVGSTQVNGLISPAGITSVENLPTEGYPFILFAKGADSVMMERMRQFDEVPEMERALKNDLDFEAKPGEQCIHEGEEGVEEAQVEKSDSEAGSCFAGPGGGPSDKPPVAPKEPAPLLEPPDMGGGNKHVSSSVSASGLSGMSERLMGLGAAGLTSWSSRAFLTSQESVVACEESKQQKKLRVAKEQLRRFSTHGLRTLICGWRVLADADAERFIHEHAAATRSWFKREEKVAEVVNQMERDFDLLGITAVEDKIQIGVPETVKMLLAGGIRVWMLTGDSVDTAVNIATICRLIDKQCKLYYLTCEETTDLKTELESQLRTIVQEIVENVEKSESKTFSFSLVINGTALYAILDETEVALQRLFVTVACNSASVIACRLSPAQKAGIVELIRKEVPGNPLTLAVGDGGNDVSMIQKAHVGVGIAGAEGREAVNASDFAIGQFRFLRSLLFLHGRSNIRRIGMVIGYSFYKNFLLVLCMACYAPWNGLSGTTLYDSYLIMMYNMVFTSFPIFIVGSLDLDVYAPAAFAMPKLYFFGVNKAYFNYRMLVAWLFRGVVHALVNFFVAVVFLGGLGGNSGHFPDYLSLGTWSYWSCVLVANSTLLLHAQVWMDWQLLISLLSVMFFPPILFIYSTPSMSNVFNPSFHDVASNLFASLPGWLSLVLVFALSVLVELALDSWRRVNRPDLVTRVQDYQRSKPSFPEAEVHVHRGGPTSTSLPLNSPSMIQVDKSYGHGNILTCQNSRSFNETRFSSVPPRSPCSDRDHLVRANQLTQTNPLTQTQADLSQGVSKYEKLFPASLVSSVPWSYKRSNCNSGNFRVEEAELKEYCRFAKHPLPKQPGLRLLLDFAWKDRNKDKGPDNWAQRLGVGMAMEWRARLNHLQWCEISLMSEVLGGGGHGEAINYEGVADRLSKSAGMQRELLHLEQLEERSAAVVLSDKNAAVLPVDYRQSRFNKSYTTEFVYNIFTLKFRSKFHEQAFCQTFDENSGNQFFVSVRVLTWVVIVGFQLVKVIAVLVAPPQGDNSSDILTSLLVIMGAIAFCEVLLFPLRFKHFRTWQASYVAITCCLLTISKHAYEIIAEEPGYVTDAIMPLFFCAGVRMRFPVACSVLFLHMVLLAVHHYYLLTETTCTVGSGNTQVFVCDEHFILRGEYSVVQFGLVLLVGAYVYVSERFARHNFAWDVRISSARGADRDILKGMYPEDVVEAVFTSFRNNQNDKMDRSVSSTETIFQDRGLVTIVFIDIYDFGRVVAGLHPVDLVLMLDRVFTQMDLVCQEHGITKIETVGKTFMAAGLGDPAKSNEKNYLASQKSGGRAVKCLEVAVAILRQFTKCVTGMDGMEKLSLKIGLNTGNVISGVVGSQKPQFALFGDTVNTASRMMSTGEVNHIHVSAETHEFLRQDDRFKWHQQQIWAKGKGYMDTYLLENEKRGQEVNVFSMHRHNSREGSMLEIASSDVPVNEGLIEGDWKLKLVTTLQKVRNLPQVFRDTWTFCGKVFELDSNKASLEKSLFVSLLLFWTCFCMEFGFIIIGETGEGAYNLDLFIQLRGSFAIFFGIFLLIGGATLAGYAGLQCLTETKEKSSTQDSLDPDNDFAAERLERNASEVSGGNEDNVDGSDAAKKDSPQRKKAMHMLFLLVHICIPVFLIAAGYFTAIASAIYGISNQNIEEVAHWIYYESLFYISAMMHLNLLRVSVTAFLCGALMVLPATGTGVLADWPAGAIYPVTVFILQMKVVYDLKWYQLKSVEDLKIVEKEHKECDTLLNSLLPKEVLHSMQTNNLELAYTYQDMSLLFADIVGFTGYCTKHKSNPSTAVRLVTHLFARFDDCCKLLGAYKVCTIGDAYLAVNEPKTQHDDRTIGALVLLHLAMAMLRIIVQVRDEVDHQGLNMRIGLHHGQFVAGVIGSNQLRFDIWGEDVLIGNQMESSGEPGRICCSETFVQVLKDFKQFSFTERELVKCAGSTRMLQSYLLDPPHGIGTGFVETRPLQNARRSGKTARHLTAKKTKGQKAKSEACNIS
ncbi:unnamed protein product [Cladocopium goreaui]|uniref:P-type phospholipid transporter n=1 Tax=Cladocopium goreaui TaxID=2562237 RepID=A0A9P1C3F5_9DINO|nr:unnamed protein product [Cladocopium goreaui]